MDQEQPLSSIPEALVSQFVAKVGNQTWHKRIKPKYIRTWLNTSKYTSVHYYHDFSLTEASTTLCQRNDFTPNMEDVVELIQDQQKELESVCVMPHDVIRNSV